MDFLLSQIYVQAARGCFGDSVCIKISKFTDESILNLREINPLQIINK